MARPRIVRADTLDLQDHNAPSAKDHTRQPTHSSGVAPHQEQTLRHADDVIKSEMMHGPGVEDDHPEAGYGDGIDIYDDDDDDIEEVDELGHHHHKGDSGGSEEGDLADGESDDMMDDDLMDKISSSPSIDDEDIDFEFVYALHNFFATVDGQANAAKGDTMVLLDDSNSYWWLVRIVKDGSIGYLPAEHIETPTERLARLNKHRNVDLSATMLGDNSEKSKNPLKKAMRRRNAKTVTFTSPTYIEASDVEYSTEEEMDDDISFQDEDMAREDADHLQDGQNEDIVVKPLRPKSQKDRGIEEDDIQEVQEPDSASSDKQRSSQEIFEAEAENAVSRSRNGTVRNTDSFFKDDTVETKKISLTPNLLRDENSSGEAKESRGSMEAIDKTLSAIDKNKDDKKRKDKKPGMLSGLFKRKDKKTKSNDEDTDEAEKTSTELSRTSPQPKTSSDSLSSPESARSPKPLVVQRQTSKLQKQPPSAMSPTRQDIIQEFGLQSPIDGKEEPRPIMSSKDQTIRQVTSEEDDDIPSSPPLGPFDDSQEAILSSARKTWEEDMSENTYSQQRSVASPPQKFTPKQTLNYQPQRLDSPLSGSPLEGPVSPLTPGLVAGLPSPGRHSVSSVSPPLSPIAGDSDHRGIDAVPASFETASAGTPTWSDASLRSYLDDENDIRDLFIIVHDNSNIPPAGPDHPITGCLFKEESKRLREMTSQLDAMLAEWVGRRTRSAASK
nr:SH3 domain protein [Aspergillus niger CBS 513.88]|eukprot:XP_001392529.2 SH3 domain protein [Aspergillus niger CBS 513.88]